MPHVARTEIYPPSLSGRVPIFFVERAPAEVIEKERAALVQLRELHASTEAAIKSLEVSKK